MKEKETTDLTLFVRTSQEDITGWNRQRIVDALIRETNVETATAEEISREVEDQIVASGIDVLTAPLIRELVDAKLTERGLHNASKMHARLGFPLYDVEQILFYSNKENANIPHTPEGTNLTLAEGIKKEYALLNVFADEVGYAHARGDIHIHNLGYIDRLYCSCQSLEFIKKFGLDLSNSLAVASPAMHAETLLAHMIRFSAALQGCFAGAVGWNAVNTFFAPYLRGVGDERMIQLAQMLIYEFAQQAVGRGGQTLFTDIHLYWDVPQHLEEVPAIGPGGRFTGSPYGAYAEEARRFARALLAVYAKGDAAGLPFVFPRPFVHISEKFFRTDGHEEFLRSVATVSLEKGNTHIIFDRDNTLSLAECGVIRTADRDGVRFVFEEPWKIRYAAVQNVSLNLPRLGYRAEGNDERLRTLLSEIMETAARAHLQKKRFIEGLLSQGRSGPLSLLTMNCDGEPYLKMNQAVYLVGLVGLNELVKIHRGEQLHESDDAHAFGMSLVAFMKREIDRLNRKHGITMILQQSPAETTAYRFARLDLKHCSPAAGHYVRGSIAGGEIYYSNSSHYSVSAPLAPFEKVMGEGEFHPLIEGNATCYVWLDVNPVPPEAGAAFIIDSFRKTKSRQIVFSPEFTACAHCKGTSAGITGTCPLCGSRDVEGIARITGYYSRTSNWNKGKIAELRDRRRVTIPVERE